MIAITIMRDGRLNIACPAEKAEYSTFGSRCRSVFKTREFRFDYLTNKMTSVMKGVGRTTLTSCPRSNWCWLGASSLNTAILVSRSERLKNRPYSNVCCRQKLKPRVLR